MNLSRLRKSNFHLWILINHLLLLLIGPSAAVVKNGTLVGHLRVSVFYSNIFHEASEGYCDRSFNDNWCDTYMVLCLTSENPLFKCNLCSLETETHYDTSHIKLTGPNAFKVPVRHPIPNFIEIEISAYDNDRFTSHDLIATFVNKRFKVPSPNTNASAKLVKVDGTQHNKNVKIAADVVLECLDNLYGENCSIECNPDKYPSMIGCRENGTSICLPGFRGQLCEKPDTCYYKPCIAGAVCINTDTPKGYRCICNGEEGAHCFAGYNPCVPSPCQNQGQCVRSGEKHDEFSCNCPMQWTGPLCEIQRSPCEVASNKLANADLQDLFGTQSYGDGRYANQTISVCKNGGICVDLMDEFKFICNCTSGWKGELCTIPDWTNAIIAGCVLTGLLIVFICAVVPCCIRMRRLRPRNNNDPITALVYNHDDGKSPTSDRVLFRDVFRTSEITSQSAYSENADNTQQYYEYCLVPSREGDVSTFGGGTGEEYEVSVEEKPPPELPIRPDCLAPLPRSQNNSLCQDTQEVPQSLRPESLYTEQPLLTPHTSRISSTSGFDNQTMDALPKRSIDSGETSLSKLFRKSKK